jgi:acetyl esterase/lipase
MLGAICAGIVCLSGCDSTQASISTTLPPPRKPVIGSPAGQFAGRRPRGAVLLIAGGGWIGVTPAALSHEVATALIFRRLGYLTVTVDYRAGAAGLTDSEQAYDLVRRRYGTLPICAIGTSAGGTLALLLAAHRPELSCVISLAGPTDLQRLRDDGHSKIAYELAVRAFGRQNLNRYSPVRYAASIHAHLLLLYASNDPLVPASQGTEMIKADPRSRLIVLLPGPTPFVHSRVSTVAAHQAEAVEVRFLADAMISKM